jgi:hypothetical protein
MTTRLSCILAAIPLLSCTVGCTSGCVVSKYPLSAEADSTLDRRLIGTWEIVRENQDRDPAHFVVERKAESNAMLLVKSTDPKEKGQPLEALPTELGKHHYLSIRGFDEKHKDVWCIFQYEWLDDDSFRLRLMDEKVLADEVNSKRVHGRVSERSNGARKEDQKKEVVTDVLLEEPTDPLREYVEKSGDKIFGQEWMTFRRVKPN